LLQNALPFDIKRQTEREREREKELEKLLKNSFAEGKGKMA
jgi:hypothetical protein